MWNKIKDRGLHLRTRQGAGAGGNGHGREYPPYLQALRNIKDENGSSDRSEGQEAKIRLLGIEEITNTASIRQALQMETETQRTSSAKGDREMTAMHPTQIEQSLDNISNIYRKLHETFGNMEGLIGRTAEIASMNCNTNISRSVVAMVMKAYAEAKAALQPELQEAHHEVMLWATIAHGLYNEIHDRGLPRVKQDIETVMSEVEKGFSEVK